MRTNGLSWLMVCALLLGSTVVAHAGRVEDRQVSQQKRIQQGIQSGSLTKREAGRLEHRQRDIQRAKKRVRADGRITPAERLQLEAMQDKANKDIYGAKHNAVERPGVP